MADTVDITKTHVPIVYVVLIIGAIVGGALAVSKTYNDTAWEVRELRAEVKKMTTADEVAKSIAKAQSDLEGFAKERVKFYLEHAAIRVAPVPGKKYQRGAVEFPIKDEN